MALAVAPRPGVWPASGAPLLGGGVQSRAQAHSLPLPSTLAQARTCTKLLSLVAPRCGLPRDPFLRSCQADLVACAHPGRPNCSCPTLSEFSRQCSAAGEPVNQWRSPGLCGEPQGDGGEGMGWIDPETLTERALPPCHLRRCGPLSRQPGVPRVRGGLQAHLLPPPPRLLWALHLWLLLSRR